MRMSNETIQRLGGLGAINPDSVTGSVIINGTSYQYRRGVLNYGGKRLMVSDDKDLIIDNNRKVFGVIVNGVVTQLSKLTAAQQSAIKSKYGI